MEKKHLQQELNLNNLMQQGYYPSVISGKEFYQGSGKKISVISPIDGAEVAQFKQPSALQYEEAASRAHQAFLQLRDIPAPKRGEFVRLLGNQFRQHKESLAQVITLETGKIVQEARGEVQEMIDICDFAVGLSRQLHGLTIVSERANHRMMEQWHPLGPVAVISAFNFPMAVWAWNAMLAFVCGDPVLWKPSEKTPLCALACQTVLQKALDTMPEIPADISAVIVGHAGRALVEDKRFPLVSATGSTAMGQKVGAIVGARLGRAILELGGNNAMILTPSADKEMALRAIVFSAVGTSGQRCTSMRRLIVQQSLVDDILPRLIKAYDTLSIGDPNDEKTTIGPLINEASFNEMQAALAAVAEQGGEVIYGGQRVTDNVPQGGVYVRPAIVRISNDAPIVQTETFAPILYVITYDEFDEALAIHNNVPQGLSSAIFTGNARESELFLCPRGSDCGIANVNIGTSGAEIGGAFGGEKETGGGRESGSDAWKAYMRRSTNTINYGTDLPLAQGIVFDL